MTETRPSLLARIPLALSTFWQIIANGEFARDVLQLRQGVRPEPAARPAALLEETSPAAALQLLGLLQRDGRFIDFIEEDVAGYSDADVGAAARVVHEGCRKVIREHFTLEPVRVEAEGTGVTLEPGFDAAAVRLTGNVAGEPPFKGALTHRGWVAKETKLPRLAAGHNVNILAPAEVEL
ncbi:MAG: DUF2760 domain-containing protein [Gammaproteobacteria bacterium]|jgi:hypothetical protein